MALRLVTGLLFAGVLVLGFVKGLDTEQGRTILLTGGLTTGILFGLSFVRGVA